MENADADELPADDFSCYIYPVDEIPHRNSDAFYRECLKKHDGKIPTIHNNDRQDLCNLFLLDVKIRESLKKCIAETTVKERLTGIFF